MEAEIEGAAESGYDALESLGASVWSSTSGMPGKPVPTSRSIGLSKLTT